VDDEDDALWYDEEGWLPTGQLHSMAGIPADARSMGLDRNVPEGAWLAFAGSLRATKPSHRLVAWLLLAAIVLPLVLTLESQLL
jgi:hypothetical protein